MAKDDFNGSGSFSTGGTGGEDAIQTLLIYMGIALGIAVAIFFTPPLFEATRGYMLKQLSTTWPPFLAWLLTWTMAVLQAFLIFTTTVLFWMVIILRFIMRRLGY